MSRVPFRFTINVYRGCSHACRWCFARPTHEYLNLDAGRDFERVIVVKVNAVDRLRAEIASRRWGGDHIAMGTNTDPYQRAEGRYKLTRGVLEVLTAAGNPFSLLTKSSLILRDLDLLKEANERSGARAVRAASSSGSTRSTTTCGSDSVHVRGPRALTKVRQAEATHTGFVLVALVLCLAASVSVLLWPRGEASYSGIGTTSSQGQGEEETSATSRPLTGDLEATDVAFFAVPVVIAAAPLVVRRRRGAIVARGIAASLLFMWVLFLAFA
ncbi:MAG: radical SAM protein, partial [Nitriliruptorales bacterium]